MNQVTFQQLTASSKAALAWAFTRARYRTSKEGSSDSVSATDLLVGVLMAHPNQSGPYQLFELFHIPVNELYDGLRDVGGFAPDNAPNSPERLDQIPPLDADGEEILSESLNLSMKLNPETDRLVRLRDLFGGILVVPSKATKLLEHPLANVGVPFQEVVDQYPEFLRYPSQEMSFSTFLAERFPPEKFPHPVVAPILPAALRFAVSGFSADTGTQKDQIGIGAEVDAFAYLLTAKALQPPMAIGLFGDWGSGKSFFMEALRQRIHKISADARSSGKLQKDISIYKYVAQIEFNAWHYVEGELLASLVEHIFRNLKTRPEDKQTLLQQRLQVVINKIEDKRRGQQADQALMADLQVQLEQAQGRLDELEKERENALKALNDLKAEDILKAVELSPKEEEDIYQALEKVGVTETYASATELISVVGNARDVLQRGNALITPLRERGWKWAAALIVVILAGPIISLVLMSVGDVPAVTNALASTAAFLSGLTIMLKQGTSWLSGALTRIEGAQLQLDAKRRETEANYATKIAEAQRHYDDKKIEYELAKDEKAKKEQAIAELEQELKEITPGRVLLDFIGQRAGSEDYRKRLGVAALIRNDFEQLSQALADQNRVFIADDNGTERDEDLHLMNRIILYIDDLDRCPPERVVEVLQAVHLLLAFPLFVVVVAVDARWLAQSLQKQYENLLTPSAGRDGLELSKGFERQASPQDYLEKIFQIPFWVRPLPEKARMRIVEGLVEESLVPPSAEGIEGDNEQAKPGDGDKTASAVSIVEEAQAIVPWEASERARPLNLDAETDLKPESLDIQAIELRFMDELRNLLGQTPRSVKRFVNVYRLIKAVSLNQRTKFVDDKPDADFKQVLFLLAVLTGMPAISREFFRLLRAERSEIEQEQTSEPQAFQPTGRTLAQVLEALHGVVPGASKILRSGPVPVGPDPAAMYELPEDNLASNGGNENWYVSRDLYRLESWLKQYDNGSWLRADATALADWAPQVVRFSYRIEEL